MALSRPTKVLTICLSKDDEDRSGTLLLGWETDGSFVGDGESMPTSCDDSDRAWRT